VYELKSRHYINRSSP